MLHYHNCSADVCIIVSNHYHSEHMPALARLADILIRLYCEWAVSTRCLRKVPVEQPCNANRMLRTHTANAQLWGMI